MAHPEFNQVRDIRHGEIRHICLFREVGVPAGSVSIAPGRRGTGSAAGQDDPKPAPPMGIRVA